MNPQCTDTVREYVNSYELCGDDGDYTPNEREQLMIEDAIHGYIAEHATPASTPLPTAPTETWSPIVESACECACHADRPYCPNCNQHCMEKRQSTVPNCHKFIRLHGGNCPVHGAVSKEEAAGERKITDSLDMALRSCVPMSRQSHIRGLINEALLTARATAACSCVERIEAISKVAATTVALMLNRSHCTGEPVHGLAHALLGNASDLGDIVNEFVKVVAPELEPEIITALSKD